MEVKNRAGVIEQMTREQYDALDASGHAKHLTIVNESDYEPGELKLPDVGASGSDKPADPVKEKKAKQE